MRLPLTLLLCLLVSLLRGQAPVADFTANVVSGCSPLGVSFTDKSTGSPKSWNWDFGNGQLSNVQNPSIGFSVGTYTVTLVVRNANGIDQVTKTGYITVNPSPTVSFKANQTLACLPATIQFTDLSVSNAGTINKWEWHFNDGGPNVAAQNPAHSYVNPGFYDVYLKVTSTTGCSAALNLPRYIRVVNGVKADFNAVGPATCSAPFTMTYKNLTSGPGNLTYTWDLGNGTTSNAVQPPATYGAAGTYTIKLKAQSEFGCADSTQKNIPVKGVASTFTSTPDTTACIGAPFVFQSTTVPAPVKVTWDFGDGTSSTDLKPPPKAYAAAGTYPVKLVSNFGNCNDTLTKNVVISTKPVVDFTADKVRTCKAPFTVNFQNLSPDVKTAVWDFGDGNTATGLNPSHTYTKMGIFDVTLTITNNAGCQNTLKKEFIYIIGPSAGVRNLPVGLCVGQAFTTDAIPSAAEGIASSDWDFGDGTPIDHSFNATHTYTAPGFYTVTYTIHTNGGCIETGVYTNAVQVGTHSVVDFSANKITPCRSDSVAFTNLSVPLGNPVLWSFGLPTDTGTSALQNPKHKYTGVGFFDVKLKVTNNGCSDSLTKPSYIQALPPLADFNYTVDCANKKTVAFRDSSVTTPVTGAPAYRWDFGDGQTSTITTPTVNYTTLGAYNVKLIVDEGLCSDTIVKNIQLIDEKADFTFNGTPAVFCRNSRVTFTSTNNAAFIKKYEWEVDGVIDFSFNQHDYPTSFTQSGIHTARLIITDINGCIDTSGPKQFTITGPTALITVGNNGGCKNAQVQFTDASTPAVGTINKWSYDFGDGSALSALQNPKHVYTDTGLYTVKFTVTDNLGCVDTFDTTALITKPAAFFSAAQTTFCPGAPLPFKDSSSGNGLQYHWSFGDGGIDSVQNPSHTYPPGKDSLYTVKLLVRDTVGCIDSLTRSNYIVTKRPKPLYTAKDTVALCAPLETKFTFKGQDFESFSWDFGDGGTSTLVNTSHFYNAVGVYTAKLYIVGYGGCLDSASIPVSLLDPSAATQLTYSPLNACNELTVHFSVSAPSFTAYKVFFGDGTFDTTHQPTFDHFYSLPNNYAPYVFLTDSTGCQANVGGSSGAIQVQGAVPLFGMDKNKFCDSGAVFFSDYSQDAVDPIVSKTWSFGDGTAPGPLPGNNTHTYTQPGLYVPTLSVTTAANCTQKFTDTVRVLATPQPIITSAPGICNDSSISFNGSLLVPPDTAIAWKWDLSKGNTSSLQNPFIHYPDTGMHHITLEATNSLGCKGDTSKDIIVYPLPAITVVGDTTTVSGGVGITIPLTYSPNVVSYTWTPEATLSCTDCPNPFANPKFTTTYNVKVVDDKGCTSTRNLTLVVTCNNKNFFIPNTFSPNNDGANDRFYPRGTGLNLIQALRIFNRWGELVFEKRNFPANDASSGWDGTYKGKAASTDTYIYMIDIICENANVITYKGNITLIR